MRTSRLGVWSLLVSSWLVACGDDPHAADTTGDTTDAELGEVETSDGTATEGNSETADEVATTAETTETVDTGDSTDRSDVAETAETTDTTDTGETTVVCTPQRDPDDGAFDDHSVLGFESVACLEQWAGDFPFDPLVLKFVIADFDDVPGVRGGGESSQTHFSQGGFYALHDEWYWFRLLNGHPIPGLATPAPVVGPTYPTVAAIYAAMVHEPVLPLDLAFLGGDGEFAGRLYSPHFYALGGFGGESPPPPRHFGMGTLQHYHANLERQHAGEIWGFDLEYVESVTEQSVSAYFRHLAAHLPPEIGEQLVWIARSPQQEGVAGAIKAGAGPLKDRVLTYDDLVVDGAVEVYNPGLTAGYINILPPGGWSPADVHPDEIAVLSRVPDDIPPVRGMVSGVPQTPLAHVNLLAKSRGTPNAYVAGVQSSGQLDDWRYTHTPVIMAADAVLQTVTWKAMTAEQYRHYTDQLRLPERHVEQVPDLASAPYTVPLDTGGVATMADLVPLIGGKAAGFLSFLSGHDMERPDDPMAITIRAYAEHVAELLPAIHAVVEAPESGDARVRYLVLEGEAGFRTSNAQSPAMLAWLEMFLLEHENDEVFGPVLAAGGVKQMVRKKAMNPATVTAIWTALDTHFAHLAHTQGLRFRSSATAEDVVGFNGAGLYDSNSGFLYPAEAIDPDERKQTLEYALKKTWSSYWGYAAFEERRFGEIDHFEGNMAVAVHPRFDDDKELANGVATHRYTAYTDPPSWRFIVNIQYGAASVTNPAGAADLPEIDEVTQVGTDAPTIRRVQASTLAPAGELLLSDADLTFLYGQSKDHLAAWLAAKGDGLVNAEKPRSLVLDYEFKRMASAWPALQSGEIRPARFVWKQARVLDSVPRLDQLPDPSFGANFPVDQFMPRDLRPVARDLRAERCTSPYFDIRFYAVRTDPGQTEQFPFATDPFVYKLYVRFTQQAPGFTWPVVAYWLPAGSFTEASAAFGGALHALIAPATANTLGLDEITVDGDRAWTLRRGAETLTGTCTSRPSTPAYQGPETYLQGLLGAP